MTPAKLLIAQRLDEVAASWTRHRRPDGRIHSNDPAWADVKNEPVRQQAATARVCQRGRASRDRDPYRRRVCIAPWLAAFYRAPGRRSPGATASRSRRSSAQPEAVNTRWREARAQESTFSRSARCCCRPNPRPSCSAVMLMLPVLSLTACATWHRRTRWRCAPLANCRRLAPASRCRMVRRLSTSAQQRIQTWRQSPTGTRQRRPHADRGVAEVNKPAVDLLADLGAVARVCGCTRLVLAMALSGGDIGVIL